VPGRGTLITVANAFSLVVAVIPLIAVLSMVSRWSIVAGRFLTRLILAAGAGSPDAYIIALRIGVIKSASSRCEKLFLYPFVSVFLICVGRNAYWDQMTWGAPLVAVVAICTLVGLLALVQFRRRVRKATETLHAALERRGVRELSGLEGRRKRARIQFLLSSGEKTERDLATILNSWTVL